MVILISILYMLTYALLYEASHSYKKVKMYTLGNLHEHFTNLFLQKNHELEQTKYQNKIIESSFDNSDCRISLIKLFKNWKLTCPEIIFPEVIAQISLTTLNFLSIFCVCLWVRCLDSGDCLEKSLKFSDFFFFSKVVCFLRLRVYDWPKVIPLALCLR